MTTLQQKVTNAAETVFPTLGDHIDCAIILGSGLSEAFNHLPIKATINYSDIPHLIVPKITSHAGNIKLVSIGKKNVALCCGRIHLYEGYHAQEVAFMTYLMSAVGANKLIITNAAGALNKNYKPGEVMLIDDHINMTGHNPIIGQTDELGQRFTDMSQAYSSDLRHQASKFAANNNLNLHCGIYSGVLGPSLETSAERRMLRTLGADAVGMSTVIESIAANHCGMHVLGLSAITNMATGDAQQQSDSIEDVLNNAALAAQLIAQLSEAVIKDA